MVKFILGSFLMLTSIAFASDQSESEGIEKEVISEIAKDIKIPLKMWEIIASKKESGANEVYIFSNVKVRLTEKNPSIVKKSIIEVEFPRGGGELDMSSYLTGNQGTFFVNFDFPEFEDADFKKVIFISNSRKRKIGDQIFGSGCHEFFDVTNRFLAESQSGGLAVNTTRNRHVTVLGGSFILVAKKNKQNYLAQVTFTDKKHKNLLCQEK